MEWREARLGGHVNPGWWPLVERLHANVIELDPEVDVVQVKEKFGGLRYYYDYSDACSKENAAAIGELVRKAEAESFTVCEVCGKPGRTDSWGHGWLNTLCDEHGAIRRETGTPAWQMAELV